MAEEESSQEKTEEPTARRLEKAREEGQIPRSRELATSVLLVFGVVGLIAFSEWIVDYAREIAEYTLSLKREEIFDEKQMIIHFAAAVKHGMLGIAPVMAMLLVGAFLGPLGVGGWLFSTKALVPKLSRMDPIQGLKRMFSLKSLVELIKAIAKVVVVGVTAYFVLSFFEIEILSLFKEPINQAMVHAGHIILWAALALACSTILIAVIDIPFQIFDHTRKLRMSFQEVKDDFKETEGKPEVKSRIRRVQYEMTQRRMLQDVPKADVVITNPDHYSVALSYDPVSMGAPILLAKGVDEIALKIREIATEHEVPIVRVPPLARSLYYHAKVGKEIPEGLYIAIAQVLAYVYQLDRYHAGKGDKPQGMPPMPIPEDLKVDEKGRQT